MKVLAKAAHSLRINAGATVHITRNGLRVLHCYERGALNARAFGPVLEAEQTLARHGPIIFRHS